MRDGKSATRNDDSAQEGTFFSQERFIRAVARSEMSNSRIMKLQSAHSPAHLFGLEHIHRFNRRRISLAPFGLPAYPLDTRGSVNDVSLLVAQLKTYRTVGFDWNVRFDHTDLGNQLEDCGMERFEETTHVLHLTRPYDALFREFSNTTRNQIRRAERKGVVVRIAASTSDVLTYYALYEKVIGEKKNWNMIYKRSLFDELFSLKDNIILLVAEINQVAIGGGWFVRDGNSLFYWQSAMNYEYKDCFPHYAIVNCAIQYACDASLLSFNMGTSGTPSLEQFKSFWGARKVPCWRFVWENPIWSSISRINRKLEWLTNNMRSRPIRTEFGRTRVRGEGIEGAVPRE
jgi:hypothetical protein